MGLFEIFKKKNKPKLSPVAPDGAYGEYPDDWPQELKLAQAYQHFGIMTDSVELIHKTVYPKTYFSRYRTAVKEAEVVVGLCKKHELGKLATQTLAVLLSDRVKITNDFLDRCDAAGKLPFVKNELAAYKSEMPKESYEYFEELLACSINEEDNDEYVFCSVVFYEGGKAYYYLSEDGDVHCGDYVTVHVGRNDEEKTGKVVKTEIFKGCNAPVPVDNLKYIIDVQ